MEVLSLLLTFSRFSGFLQLLRTVPASTDFYQLSATF